MHERDLLIGSILEETWLTIDQAAAACVVETAWLVQHLETGLFPDARSVAGTWRISHACLSRARRMRQLELTFDADPELAALVADMLQELDELRSRLRRAGLD